MVALEINAEYQPGAVALEIDEIEGGMRAGRTPPSLDAPGCRQPCLLTFGINF